jgi:hypothetical protein
MGIAALLLLLLLLLAGWLTGHQQLHPLQETADVLCHTVQGGLADTWTCNKVLASTVTAHSSSAAAKTPRLVTILLQWLLPPGSREVTFKAWHGLWHTAE